MHYVLLASKHAIVGTIGVAAYYHVATIPVAAISVAPIVVATMAWKE